MAGPAGAVRRSVSVDGLGITYEDAGAGSPAVVLIHGAFEDRTYFASQIGHLARRQRVIALDLRGHGESDVPPTVRVEDFTTDVLAVCADAGIECAVLCGHSVVGAAVALSVAVARPDLVRAIAILDAVLFPPPQWREALENLLPALDGDRWLEALRGYMSRTLDAKDPPELAARVMEDLGQRRPEIARSLVASFLAVDLANSIQELRCPLLYVHAKAPADLTRLAQLRPDALIGQVVGSGHYLMLAVPDQVNAMLDRFLELVDPNGGSHPS